MSRTHQKLINYNTSGENNMPLVTDVNFGEIVVRHNEKNQELLIKVNSGGTETFVAFGSKAWVNEQIKNATDALEENLNQSIANVSGAVWSISADIKTYIDQMDTSLQGQINSTNRELGYVSSSTVGLSGVVESFSGVVYRDYATKAYVNGKVEDIDSDISELNTKVNNFSSATWNAFSGIYDTYATSANVHTTIDRLNTQVGYLSSSTVSLSGVVATLSANTENTFVNKSTYSGYTASTNTSITNLQNNLNKLSGVTSALSANVITALDEIVSSITTDLSTVYKYKGSVPTVSDLPEENNEVGDVYNVVAANGEPGQTGYTPAGTNYAWVGPKDEVPGHWDALGGVVDLSNYATTAITNGLDTRLQSVETGLTALSGATSAFSASVVANYATRSEVSAETSAVKTQLGYLSGATSALSAVVATFSAATEATFVDKSTYSAYTGNVNTTITNIQNDLKNLSGATSAFSSTVVTTYATKSEVSAETSAVMTEVGYLSSSTVSLSGVVKTLSGVVYTDYARKSELKTVSDKLDALDTDVRSNLSASTVALSGVVGTIQQTAGNAITGVELGQVSASTSDSTTEYASGAKVNSTKGQNAIIDLSELIIDCGTF